MPRRDRDRRAAEGARSAGSSAASAAEPHLPVLLDEALAALAPVAGGVFIDGTFGAGGYTKALLAAGAARVIAVDRDPAAIAVGRAWAGDFGERLTLLEGRFGDITALLEDIAATGATAAPVDGLVFDVGVSSMQLDQAGRGFSFLRDGPLDMRMEGSGGGDDAPSAADLAAEASEKALADMIFHLGEDRAARRLARALVVARADAPIETTRRLAEIIEAASPRPKPGQAHPATRAFQAFRIAVNDELGELARGLQAAEAVLAPGGRLAVVSFHSLEDRIVKRFLHERAGRASKGSRHEPEINRRRPSFELEKAGAVAPSAAETDRNPRARSAKLRWGRRTEAAPWPSAPSPQEGLTASALLGRRR